MHSDRSSEENSFVQEHSIQKLREMIKPTVISASIQRERHVPIIRGYQTINQSIILYPTVDE